jgi:hypothetical protein
MQSDPDAITPARNSLHPTGNAVDVSYSSLSKVVAGLTPDQQRTLIRETARSAGLVWGGTFQTPDPPHFQSDPWGTSAAGLAQRREAASSAYFQVRTIQWSLTDRVP